MTAAAFLRSLGRTCSRCGLPMTCRFGPDLVEPDSGGASCVRCAETVEARIHFTIHEGLDAARRLFRPTWCERARFGIERLREARRRGWRG